MLLSPRRRGLALALCCLVAACATPPVTEPVAAPACEAWDGGAFGISTGATMLQLPAANLAAFVAGYNALEPPSSYEPDSVYLFASPRASLIGAVLVRDNCILNSGTMSLSVLERLLGVKRGEDL